VEESFAGAETHAPEGATAVFHRQATAPTGQISATPAPTGKLLVVDDDEGNRVMLARRLARLGHTTTLATNGREALARLRTESFDLMLLDIQMPEMNGYEVLDVMKADPVLSQVPVIVLSASDETARVARCVEMGAEDYLPKPFDPILLRARIGACLEKKILRERERQAFEALKQSQKILSDELAEAAQYVRSILPAPLEQGPVQAAWRFHPSTQLGGDAFGYHWLDDKHFAFFLLDVCGHGVGAALLSVSVMHTLSNRTMRGVNFQNPGTVLGALNRTFAMEKHNNMFFTIWYGVYSTDTRELAFASGGHPPTVLIDPAADGARHESLRTPGAIVGGFPEARFQTARRILAPGACLYVLSDGVYELARPDGTTAQFEDFLAHLGAADSASRLDSIVNWAKLVRGGAHFEDDVSLVELRFV
jgi:sigma-B regulation protein RsbU (phosphoserine phosphatase)